MAQSQKLNEKKKAVSVIVKYLEKDGEELTPENLPYKMKKLFLHFKQEGKKIPENFDNELNWGESTKKVAEIIEKRDENYEPPHVTCTQISAVMHDILETHFGHESEIVECYPKHLNRSKHFLVHDKTEGKYMDGSTYKGVFQPDKKDWVLLEDAEFVFEDGRRSEFKLEDIPKEYVNPVKPDVLRKARKVGKKLKGLLNKK